MDIDLEKVPREILEKAINLRNASRKIYLTLYIMGKPSTATEIGDKVGFARAYTNMRLCELVDRELVKREREDRKALFEVVEG